MTRRPGRPLPWLAATAAAGGLLLGAVAAPAAAAEPAILTHGHIDLFETSYDDAADRLVVQVKDDTRIYGDETFFRAPEDVVLVVDPELSAVAIPDFEPLFFLGEPGDTVYLLPMTQDERLPWPGWSSERLAPGLLEGDMFQLDLAIDGPGEVFSFMDDPVGMPVARYVDTTDAEPDRIPVGVGAHAHTNWVFTEVGEYTFVVTASGTKTDGTPISSAPVSYQIVVGDRGEPGDLAQRITVALDEGAGALVASVDPEDDVADLGELELSAAGDRWIADGELRPVTVTDTRATAPGWQVSGQLSEFASGSTTLGARHLGWTPRVDQAAAGQDVDAGPVVPAGFEAGDGLGISQVLATSPAGTSLGTAVLGAELHLEAPTTLMSGSYEAVLTFTAI